MLAEGCMSNQTSWVTIIRYGDTKCRSDSIMVLKVCVFIDSQSLLGSGVKITIDIVECSTSQ